MRPVFFNSGMDAISQVGRSLRMVGQVVKADKWQGIQALAPMWEMYDVSFRFPIQPELEMLRYDLHPNLPWADEHFEERVGGVPTNPGESWKNWPFYPRGERDKLIRSGGTFTHTYQERFWPKNAPLNQRCDKSEGDHRVFPMDHPFTRGYDDMCQFIETNRMYGIRYLYGDLNDVVGLLNREPLTRQAFLPIFFPEDTGAVHGGRIPCTLGYLFMYRGGFLHCTYYIRSCDYFRHFRDDLYLACRLDLWIRERLQFNPKPGLLTMHVGSLHCWQQERETLPK